MNVAIIPARGGSKRIPRKNIRAFQGRPVIAYSIDAAQQSGLFQRIVVSTDDDEIMSVARALGAEIPFRRPAAISDDYATTTDVVAHAVEFLRQSAPPMAVCCIYATAPFLRPQDLRDGYATLTQGDWNYVFAATDFGYPIWRSFRATERDGVEMFFPEHGDTRSQDLPRALHDAGQFYWGRPDAWLQRERMFGAKSTVVMLPRWRVQDLDTDDDWARAEMMAAYARSV